MKRLVCFIFVMVLLGCSPKRRSMSIGYDPAFARGHIEQKQPNIQGFLQDLVHVLSAEGLNLRLVPLGPDHLERALDEKRVDLVFATIRPHDQNKVSYRFSKEMIPLGSVVVVRADYRGKLKKQFSGKIMAVKQNTGYATTLVQQIPGVVIVPYDNLQQAYGDLTLSIIDGLVDVMMNAYYQTTNLNNNQLKIGSDLLDDFAYRFVGKQEDSSLFFDLLDLHQNKVKELRKKWDLPVLD